MLYVQRGKALSTKRHRSRAVVETNVPLRPWCQERSSASGTYSEIKDFLAINVSGVFCKDRPFGDRQVGGPAQDRRTAFKHAMIADADRCHVPSPLRRKCQLPHGWLREIVATGLANCPAAAAAVMVPGSQTEPALEGVAGKALPGMPAIATPGRLAGCDHPVRPQCDGARYLVLITTSSPSNMDTSPGPARVRCRAHMSGTFDDGPCGQSSNPDQASPAGRSEHRGGIGR